MAGYGKKIYYHAEIFWKSKRKSVEWKFVKVRDRDIALKKVRKNPDYWDSEIWETIE